MLLWLLVGFAMPLAYTLLIYPSLAALNLVSLGNENLSVGYFVIGLLQSLVFSTGEEIGWRGFASPLVTRRFGFVPGQLFLGLGWFLYHLPALFFTGYGKSPHPVAGNVFFLVAVVGLSLFLGFVREVSGSLWPCAMFHAAHNLLFLHLFDPMKRTSEIASWLIGEQGLLLALTLAMAGAYGIWAQRRITQLKIVSFR